MSRILALEKPVLLVNVIGTGMYHDLQCMQWTSLARARAIENEVHVVGCCHNTEGIPLAFAYRSNGETILDNTGQKNHEKCNAKEFAADIGNLKKHHKTSLRLDSAGKHLSRSA